jgi:hypothetical protein
VYKTLSIALLLAVVGLAAARSGSTQSSSPASPTIVASVALANQTAVIPPTIIFTPTHTGLYRLSVYMTQTVSVPRSVSLWKYNLSWVDDAGIEGTRAGILPLGTDQKPPSAWGTSNVYSPGGTAIFEAIAGQPVSYSVLNNNPEGSYSLYLTVEQLF